METDIPKFKTIEEEMEYYKQKQREISDKRARERAKFGMFDHVSSAHTLALCGITIVPYSKQILS